MDPNSPTTNSSQPEAPKSSKNTLTLISILVLAGIVGTTLFLYMQNRQTPTNKPKETAQQNNKEVVTPTIAILPTLTAKELKEKYPNVACRRFTDLNEALQAVPIACILDLSGKGISSLPNEITKLTNLNEINLSNNKFTEIPKILFEIPTLNHVILSNNQIKNQPDLATINKLHPELDGNPITLTPSPTIKK